MKKDGKHFSVVLLSALALGAVGVGVVLAFLGGYFLGHFTGHEKTTTVSIAATESAERSGAEAEPATGAESEPGTMEAEVEPEAKPEPTTAEGESKGSGASTAKGGSKGSEKGGSEKAGSEKAGGSGAELKAGESVFTANCGGCHTLAEAGTSGAVGPNLDELMPEKALVEKQVTNGGGGMPAFGGTLSPEEIEAVATYVSQVAGTSAG